MILLQDSSEKNKKLTEPLPLHNTSSDGIMLIKEEGKITTCDSFEVIISLQRIARQRPEKTHNIWKLKKVHRID